MTFEVHPDSPKTAPGPGGVACGAETVTVDRRSISEVWADNLDPEAFLLVTDSGPIHVRVKEEDLLAWLNQEVGN